MIMLHSITLHQIIKRFFFCIVSLHAVITLPIHPKIKNFTKNYFN